MLTAPATPPTSPAFVRREVQLGRSQQGRSIRVWEIGDPRSRAVELVVGCIHGNEPAGIAVAERLTQLRPPTGTLLWVVPDLNPDGVAAGTRQNAGGVDLNRNFPGWRAQGRPGSTFYSGPRPLSERESRLAAALVRRVRPRVSIWFHQHLNLVDVSGGDRRIERRFARLAGMRTGVLSRYPGSAVTWENAAFPSTTSFVVELPAGPVPAARVGALARAVQAVGAPAS